MSAPNLEPATHRSEIVSIRMNRLYTFLQRVGLVVQVYVIFPPENMSIPGLLAKEQYATGNYYREETVESLNKEGHIWDSEVLGYCFFFAMGCVALLEVICLHSDNCNLVDLKKTCKMSLY